MANDDVSLLDYLGTYDAGAYRKRRDLQDRLSGEGPQPPAPQGQSPYQAQMQEAQRGYEKAQQDVAGTIAGRKKPEDFPVSRGR